jgi:hypothetical protein
MIRQLYSEHFRLAAHAANDACNHMRDYADSTDDPLPEAIEVADSLDAITDLLVRMTVLMERVEQAVVTGSAYVIETTLMPSYGGPRALGRTP